MTQSLARVDVECRAGGATVVTVAGEIDLSNAAQLERKLEDAAQLSGELVLDLTALEYMDSQGVRVLHQLTERHVQGLIRMTIVVKRDSVAGDVLAITRIGDTVPVVEPQAGPGQD